MLWTVAYLLISARAASTRSRKSGVELVGIEGGPWAQWGKGRHKKPITQNALARLLKPHHVFPVDVGPEHCRRKGYRRAQFERLFQAYLNSPPAAFPSQPRSRAEDNEGAHA